jgi:putative transcription factor
MVVCEMCGKSGSLVNARVEGAAMQLCSNCSKYGQVLIKPQLRSKRSFAPRPGEDVQVITNVAYILQKSRNSRTMTQKEFADLLSEKLSVVQKWEAGTMKPSIVVAKKLERVLQITLLEKIGEHKGEKIKDGTLPSQTKKSSASFTLGDFIKVRKN